MFSVFAAGLLFVATAAAAQAPAVGSHTCRWLTPAEAGLVIGDGATLAMAVENGACVYVRGAIQLQIAKPARIDDPRTLRLGFDSMKQHRKGHDEPDIGDAAFVADNRREVAFLKGNAFVVITLEGRDVESRLPALKEAARKVAQRF